MGLLGSACRLPWRSRRLHHRVTQEHICFRLVTFAVTLQPFEYIGIQPHGYRLFRWAVIFSHLGSGPIDDFGHLGEINVLVFFCRDVCDLKFLFFCELLHRLVSLARLRFGLK